MQKKFLILIIIIVVIILSGVIYLLFANKNSQTPEATPTPIEVISSPTPNPTPSPLSNSNCTSDQLSATASFEPAAGNIYGKLTITNISNEDCNITLGNYLSAAFTANNISTSYKDSGPTSENYMLTHKTSVYSQVHFPNGPQCQSEISSQTFTLTYQTDNTKVSFKDADGKDSFGISACSDINENTVIDIWPVSVTPIS